VDAGEEKMSDAQPLFPSRRKDLDGIMEQLLNPGTQKNVNHPIGNSGDFLELLDVKCYDTNGSETERYERLLVKKDVEKDKDGNILKLTPYEAIHYFEQGKNGLFLPSFQLTCAIVARLYAEKDTNPEAKKVLDQYKNRGYNSGWHTTNTIVNWPIKTIVNYPNDTDFPNNGGVNNINSNRSRTITSIKDHFKSEGLADSLCNTSHKEYLQDLTGLQKPEVLIDISTYFGKTPKIWTPNTPNYVSGAWLGCYDDSFDIVVNGNRNVRSAVRGVRSGAR
jgi:hypothetical protein